MLASTRVVVILAVGSALWAGLPWGVAAQEDGPFGKGRAGFTLGVFSSKVDRALFRPSGQVPVVEKHPARAGRVGLQAVGQRGGLELAVSYWGAELGDHTIQEGGFSPTTYHDIGVQYVFGDLGVFVAPVKLLPLALSGVVGLGGQHWKYSFEGHPADPRVGQHSDTEFVYSYGLGLRLFPHWPISLAGEYRWTPGDSNTQLNNCRPSDPGWQVCDVGKTSTANRTHTLTGGVVVFLPLWHK